MPADRRLIGHDDVIAKDTIVRDARSRHEHAVIAGHGYAATFFGAGVHDDILAHQHAITDDQLRRFTLVRQMLRRTAQAGKRVDDAISADLGHAIDNDMRFQYSPVLERYLWPDNAIGPDLDPFAELRAFGNNRGRVYRYSHLGLSTTMAANSASQTILSFT